MSPVLVPKERAKPATVTSTYRAAKALIVEIDAAAKRIGISRNEAFCQLLRIGLDALDQQPARRAKR